MTIFDSSATGPDLRGSAAVPAGVAEQLSALLDDELPTEEMPLLLARFGRPGLPASDGGAERGVLARYALIGEALRGPVETRALEVASRVGAVLDTPESGVGSRRTDSRDRRDAGRWWLPAGLAASTALAAVLVSSLGPDAGGPAVAGPVGTGLTAGEPGIVAQAGAGLPAGQLADYLVYHGEYSGALSTKLVDSHIVTQRSAVWVTATAAP